MAAPERQKVCITLRKARILNSVALSCRLTGRFAEARTHYEAAIALLEALPRPLDTSDGGEWDILCQVHTNTAQLCRTQAVADVPGFIRHMRASIPPGPEYMTELTASRAAFICAPECVEELVKHYKVGQLDEVALQRERTRENVDLAARTGFKMPNPRAWVLRDCAGCGGREAEPGQYKLCGGCGACASMAARAAIGDARRRHGGLRRRSTPWPWAPACYVSDVLLLASITACCMRCPRGHALRRRRGPAQARRRAAAGRARNEAVAAAAREPLRRPQHAGRRAARVTPPPASVAPPAQRRDAALLLLAESALPRWRDQGWRLAGALPGRRRRRSGSVAQLRPVRWS